MKNNQTKLTIFWIITLAIIFGGYYFFKIYQKKEIDEIALDETIADLEGSFGIKCENGEWIEFPRYEGDSKDGVAREMTLRYPNEEKFTDDDGSNNYITDKEYSLDFFADRKVVISGIKLSGDSENTVYVEKIKCSGEEADRKIQGARQKLMGYLNENIDSIAPEAAKDSKWMIETFYFVNNNDLYVEYESERSFSDEGPFDAKLWLIRVSDLDKDTPEIETLAYITKDEEDPEKNIVKQGEDIYKDVANMTIYELDDEGEKWVLQ